MFALWNPLALENRGRKGRKKGKRRGSRRTSRRGSSRGYRSDRRYSRKGGKGRRGSRMTDEQILKRLSGFSKAADVRAELRAMGVDAPDAPKYVDLGWINRLVRSKTPADQIIEKLQLQRYEPPPKGLRGYKFIGKTGSMDDLGKALGQARTQSQLAAAFRRSGVGKDEAQALAKQWAAKVEREARKGKSNYRVRPNGIAALVRRNGLAVLTNPLALTNGIMTSLGDAPSAVMAGAVGTVLPAIVGSKALDYATPMVQEYVLYKVADVTSGIPVVSSVTSFTADVIPNIATSSIAVAVLGYGTYRMLYSVPVVGGILAGGLAGLATVAAVKDSEAIMDWAMGLKDSLMGGSEESPMLAEATPNGLGALAYGQAYGDGGFFEVAPVGARSSALSYPHASLADAAYCGTDFAVDEGQAFLNGPQDFTSRFGAPTQRQGRRPVGPSHYASVRGHRWGWLVKLVGWQGAAKIANMPPKKRLKAIQKIRQSAISAYQQEVLATEASDAAALSLEASPSSSAGHAAMGALGSEGPMGAGAAPGAYGSALFLGA